jgi:molybdopterin synthase sulfur carrier subunit
VRVLVRVFAVARQAAGCDAVEIELAEGATVAGLRSALAARLPQLSGLARQLTFAIDARYVPDDAVIPPGSEVACIPPVSGG